MIFRAIVPNICAKKVFILGYLFLYCSKWKQNSIYFKTTSYFNYPEINKTMTKDSKDFPDMSKHLKNNNNKKSRFNQKNSNIFNQPLYSFNNKKSINNKSIPL